MSRVHDVLRGDKEQPIRKQWYIKTQDGTVYGPVNLPVLCDWASQSRIAPGNLISDNLREWMPAENLSELKMEWLASLPNGETYGPFNVLAIPHLVQNGILPPESKLTNRLSGKTLNVKDVLKPAPDSSQEHAYGIMNEPTAKAPAEQKKLDSSSPLLHEAEVQRSIDKMTSHPPAPVELKTPDEPDLKTADSAKPVKKEAIANTDSFKDALSKLSMETDQLKKRLETTEKELASQKSEKEQLTKQAAAKEEQLKSRLEQTEKELGITREELSSIKQRTSEDPKGVEAITKQAIKKEQDLNRALEETRRKAEADAGLLFKTKAQLEETRTQKTEIQNRA